LAKEGKKKGYSYYDVVVLRGFILGYLKALKAPSSLQNNYCTHYINRLF